MPAGVGYGVVSNRKKLEAASVHDLDTGSHRTGHFVAITTGLELST